MPQRSFTSARMIDVVDAQGAGDLGEAESAVWPLARVGGAAPSDAGGRRSRETRNCRLMRRTSTWPLVSDKARPTARGRGPSASGARAACVSGVAGRGGENAARCVIIRPWSRSSGGAAIAGLSFGWRARVWCSIPRNRGVRVGRPSIRCVGVTGASALHKRVLLVQLAGPSDR